MAAIDPERLCALLSGVHEGRISVAEAVAALRTLPYEDLGFAKLDHHRALRGLFPEVVFGEGKSPTQIAEVTERIAATAGRFLVTRVSPEAARAVRQRVPAATYHEVARAVSYAHESQPALPGILILSGGTADLPVAEEAAVTAQAMGHQPQRIYDVGVAGVHRLLDHLEELRKAHVVVAVAGMEGALPSVAAGLVAVPVVAVPTSVGYGASFGGLAPLLAMLNSCAPGVAVVNIDNGFGAGYLAAAINSLASGVRRD